jgi:hypothetical protein
MGCLLLLFIYEKLKVSNSYKSHLVQLKLLTNSFPQMSYAKLDKDKLTKNIGLYKTPKPQPPSEDKQVVACVAELKAAYAKLYIDTASTFPCIQAVVPEDTLASVFTAAMLNLNDMKFNEKYKFSVIRISTHKKHNGQDMRVSVKFFYTLVLNDAKTSPAIYSNWFTNLNIMTKNMLVPIEALRAEIKQKQKEKDVTIAQQEKLSRLEEDFEVYSDMLTHCLSHVM